MSNTELAAITLEDKVKELKGKVADLSCLIRVSSILNSTLNLSELLQHIMEISEQVMKAEASSLMLIDEETNELVFEITRGEKGKEIKEKFRLKMGQGIAGWVALNGEPLLIPDVSKDPRFYSKPDKSTGFVTRSIACVPMRVKKKVIGILEIINPVGKKEFDESDMQLLSAFADSASVAVENARMVESLMKQQRVEQELSIAKQIQANFLPKRFPRVKGAGAFGRNVTALQIGGDFYDFVRLGDSLLAVLIGDVSGKGVPAALYMVKIVTDFRSILADVQDPARLIGALNERLCRQSTMGMFATIIYGIFDTKAGTLTYVSAGHPAPIVIGADGRARSEDGVRNPPVGVVPRCDFRQTDMRITPGERFLFYTDGVVEARNTAGEEYGTGRLMSVCEKHQGPPKNMASAVLGDIMKFSRNVPQHDDITLVAVRIGDA
ncbi:MAG TPA: SpoIIE family protein phosphatase [bacterium]|nr:SpoIIE family protein phosphatase [bacterium]